MFTLLGDANLDGSVNGTDLGILATNFNKSVTGFSGWDQGDFNYDGSVNGTDLGYISSNFNQGISAAVITAANPATVFFTSADTSTVVSQVLNVTPQSKHGSPPKH